MDPVTNGAPQKLDEKRSNFDGLEPYIIDAVVNGYIKNQIIQDSTKKSKAFLEGKEYEPSPTSILKF